MSVHTPFEEVLFAPDDQCNDGAEVRLAVRLAVQLTQQFVDVRLIVVAIGVGIACSVHPRLSAERIDFQTGVVGKDVEAVALVHKARFEQRIALERVGRFGNVFVAVDVGQRNDFEFVAHHGGDFFEFVGVVGRNDETLFHRLGGGKSLLLVASGRAGSLVAGHLGLHFFYFGAISVGIGA